MKMEWENAIMLTTLDRIVGTLSNIIDNTTTNLMLITTWQKYYDSESKSNSEIDKYVISLAPFLDKLFSTRSKFIEMEMQLVNHVEKPVNVNDFIEFEKKVFEQLDIFNEIFKENRKYEDELFDHWMIFIEEAKMPQHKSVWVPHRFPTRPSPVEIFKELLDFRKNI